MLIDALQESGTKLPVHFDRRAYDGAGELLVGHALGFSLRPCASAANYFTSASFPFSMLITAISMASTPFFSAQYQLTQSPR